MKAPFFTLSSYTQIMNKPYNEQDTSTWLDFWDIVNALDTEFVKRFAALDTRKLGPYLVNHQFPGASKIGDKTCTLQEKIVAMKLLSPTLYRCPYFFWTQGEGKHMGIDIILPQGTPLESVSDGEVVRIKKRDQQKKDEGNCIVIKTPDNHFIGYEHLEHIDVEVGDHITSGQIIGTCGTTGNSTQFHLHLQVDKASAPFHPYRTTNIELIEKHTIDPLIYLHSQNPSHLFTDLPSSPSYRQAIISLSKKGLIKGFAGNIFPEKTLSRYEMALLIHRICKKQEVYASLPIIYQTRTPYTDTQIDDDEFKEALRELQKYGIMKGFKQRFMPHHKLKGEELLALLGRIFYGLSDATTTPRRQPYLDTFIVQGIVSPHRPYIKKPLPRKEVFLIIQKLLER